ncbi:NAD-dependent epimerase/dehydratase family protein [Bacillus testis]|uniref:NAD-dependent epimerase/dehydratase family protein n=1 Tax=Bacillus testis TaxID=1622072 RepID=UPI00067EAB03|nr:NAD-dependent epimerase/dehydratase family protein [Bacillus testis]
MRVLITGGYGFIGSSVAEKFHSEGHEIYILDNIFAGKKSNVSFEHIALIEDIQSEKCELFFKENSFDAVIHLAAQTLVQHSINQPVIDCDINIKGLCNILDLSAKYGVKQFVFASSAAVYGNNAQSPLSETAVCEPASPYGLNKWVGEQYCQLWETLFGLKSIVLRFSNVYGPKNTENNEGSVIPLFMNQLLRGDHLWVYGDGEQTRDFIFVEDVSEAIYRFLMAEVSGIFNLSTFESCSINGLIQSLQSFIPDVDVIYLPAREGDIRHSLLENHKLTETLGWHPQYKLIDGLKKTYEGLNGIPINLVH